MGSIFRLIGRHRSTVVVSGHILFLSGMFESAFPSATAKESLGCHGDSKGRAGLDPSSCPAQVITRAYANLFQDELKGVHPLLTLIFVCLIWQRGSRVLMLHYLSLNSDCSYQLLAGVGQ